jgi:hypothetical protein
MAVLYIFVDFLQKQYILILMEYPINMDKRTEKRHSVPGFNSHSKSPIECRVEFDLNGLGTGRITDLSPSGIGFEIDSNGPEKNDELQALETFFIKIFFNSEFILAGARIAWLRTLRTDGSTVLKGGLEFDIMSAEDRIRLIDIIENVRKANNADSTT